MIETQFRLGHVTIVRAWLPVNAAWAVWRVDAPSGAVWGLRLHATADLAAADFEHRITFLRLVVSGAALPPAPPLEDRP